MELQLLFLGLNANRTSSSSLFWPAVVCRVVYNALTRRGAIHNQETQNGLRTSIFKISAILAILGVAEMTKNVTFRAASLAPVLSIALATLLVGCGSADAPNNQN
jgi:hypothetical protein